MRRSIRLLFAIPGAAAIALSLCGSTSRPVNNTKPPSPKEISLYNEGRRLYSVGEYTRAGESFRAAALEAGRDGALHQLAMNWNNAGSAALARQDFRDALPDFLKARRIAENSRLWTPFAFTMNNLAALYLKMGDAEAAMRVAQEGLSAIQGKNAGSETLQASSGLRYQLAVALSRLHRFDEAEPIYRRAIGEMSDRGDFDAAVHALGNFGKACLEANRLDEGEDVLSEALRLVWLHRLKSSADVLRNLAKLKSRQGDSRSAAALFDAAIRAPQNLTPRWSLYADRGEFRLGRNDLPGALADFREALRLAMEMRADVIPADGDRIGVESGLSRVTAGLVEAGNRLAQRTFDAGLLEETFNAAEQGRFWSLRALIPAADDWRTHLPGRYWDLLARYQSIERTRAAGASAELDRRSQSMRVELGQIEAVAANGAHGTEVADVPDGETPLEHVRRVLDAGTVLLSFEVSPSGGWIWAACQGGIDVYPIPGLDALEPAVASFARAVQNGDSRASALGRDLYETLFGRVPARYLSHKRWLIEPDGPLYNLPFGALVTGPDSQGGPGYLFERAAVQLVPGALMLARPGPFGSGPFLGVGDPIYNAADTRYRGALPQPGAALPRLPASADELRACARAWNPARSEILTGPNAAPDAIRTALNANPSVIHFATHVIRGADRSGLIALSLNRSGAMEFMGPAEIVTHRLPASLVVLDGCRSGQGKTLPGTGLMGLTRAWIGAGARSVLATRWDIPDEAGAAMMVEFYRALRAHPERGAAF
ncbi:MAG TPA: CHAT domain-containing protein, partial [Bryobacteraceae bacterium]|nr:CHAT domain-containing protein [Bryobacteraceae bacterium]